MTNSAEAVRLKREYTNTKVQIQQIEKLSNQSIAVKLRLKALKRRKKELERAIALEQSHWTG